MILADDLTGAGDSAIALAGESGTAEVYLDAASARIVPAKVSALDLHTRGMPVEDACLRVAIAAARAPAGVEIYKKIDSTLRGHIGAELAALCEHLPESWSDGDHVTADLQGDDIGRGKAYAAGMSGERRLCIVAPAFPGMGRTIEGGELRMHGQPVDAAALWGEGAPCAGGGIAAELRTHGFECLPVYLADIRAARAVDLAARMAKVLHGDVGGRHAIVCDAQSMDDLRRVVQAARMLPAHRIWVGSAGLAQALADAEAPDAISPGSVAPDKGAGRRSIGFVVGSFSAVAAEQVRALAEGGHAAHVALPVDELIGGVSAGTARRIDEILATGRDLVLSIPRDEVRPALAPQLSAGMARIAQGILPCVGAVVCCGGDTSRALLYRIGAHRLRVRRCAEPGATWAWCDVRPDLPLVMKAGAFGDARSLIRLRQALRMPEGHTFT
jgi:uncharacterized protein YgbK (DUF1537 family)